jgi:hypothetical protein
VRLAAFSSFSQIHFEWQTSTKSGPLRLLQEKEPETDRNGVFGRNRLIEGNSIEESNWSKQAIRTMFSLQIDGRILLVITAVFGARSRF